VCCAASCTFPSGVLQGWELSHLSGWRNCYDEAYSHGTIISDLVQTCNVQPDTILFVGVIDTLASMVSTMVGAYTRADNSWGQTQTITTSVCHTEIKC